MDFKEPSRRSQRIRAEVDYCELDNSDKQQKGENKTSRKGDKNIESSINSDTEEGHRYSCSDCDKSFIFENSLSKHIKADHEKDSFNCDNCDKSFNYQSNLIRHKNIKHAPKVSYKCNQCEKHFMYKFTLKKHSIKFH